MNEYISREAIKLLCDDILQKLDELWACEEFTYGDYTYLHDLVCAVKYISPADVVPVVRCKDCRYGIKRQFLGRPFIWCNRDGPTAFDDDFYCANGERRE